MRVSLIRRNPLDWLIATVTATATLVLAASIVIGVRAGVPPWTHFAAAVALAAGAAAFPIELRRGPRLNWGELALMLGLALLSPAWLVVATAGKALGARPYELRKTVYNTAARCLAVAVAVTAARALHPGDYRVSQPRAVLAMAAAALIAAIMNDVFATAAISVAQHRPWRRVALDGTAANMIMVVGNIVAGLTILGLAEWQPATLVLLPPAFLGLRHLYASGLRSSEDAQLSRGLVQAHRRVLSSLDRDGVASTLADEAARLFRAPYVLVSGSDGEALASGGDAGLAEDGPVITEPLQVAGEEQGQLTLMFTHAVQLSEREQEALTTLADAGAVAIEKAELHAKAQHDAIHDPLTGLPNRRRLLDVLEATLAAKTAGVEEGSGRVALLLVDLDHFKDVNDKLGHPVGDLVLLQVAERLRAEVRQGDMVARLAGDEFAIVLDDLPGGREMLPAAQSAALEVAEHLVGVLGRQAHVDGVEVGVGGSIGVALWPDNAATVDELYRCADIALYDAKKHRGRVCRYDRRNDIAAIKRLQLEPALTDALAAGDQLVLRYQMQVDLFTSGAIAAEVFTHWRHPTLGVLPESTVRQVASRCGLQTKVTRYTLDRALADRRGWAESAGVDLPVAVNLSLHDLLDKRLPAAVARLLARHNTPGDRLTLEISESIGVGGLDTVAEVMAGLAALGVQLSLDGFGTGGASLVLLHEAEDIHEVKIDQSLVARLDRPAVGDLIHAMIDSAHSLRKRTVALGVEDADQMQALHRMGCTAVQGVVQSETLGADGSGHGSLFGPPMPAGEVPAALRRAAAEKPRGGATVIAFGRR
ncbi:MAG: putative bifunctional diguanylate cyclase/phosphodiesterase [Mycobacteriales bacterium]